MDFEQTFAERLVSFKNSEERCPEGRFYFNKGVCSDNKEL